MREKWNVVSPGDDRAVDDRVAPRELDLQTELVLVPEQRGEDVGAR